MVTIFNSEAKVNILLYFIVLKLELVVYFKVTVIIKKAGNYKSIFIDYISNVLVYIEDVMIY